MKSFKIILLFAVIGLAFADLDPRRIRELLGDDADDFFRSFPEFSSTTPRPTYRRNPNEKSSHTPLDKSKDCKCRVGTSARIVNGQIAAAHSIPWQVSLARYGQHFCGASIVSKDIILTAAHCIDQLNAEDVEVRVGIHKLTDANSQNTYRVRRIIMHPYTTVSVPGDIAILELESSIEFIDNKVEPACLNLNHTEEYSKDLMVSGWGTTSASRKNTRTGELKTGDVSPILKQAFLFEDRNARCRPDLICLNSNNGDSVCQGDSGGPVHNTVNGKTSVEGVASFVTGMGKVGSEFIYMCTGSGSYSRLSYYDQWIEDIIGDNYCSL